MTNDIKRAVNAFLTNLDYVEKRERESPKTQKRIGEWVAASVSVTELKTIIDAAYRDGYSQGAHHYAEHAQVSHESSVCPVCEARDLLASVRDELIKRTGARTYKGKGKKKKGRS